MGYGILVLFLLYQLSFSSSLPHLCHNHQALALLQFKHMFTINSTVSYSCYDYINGQRIDSYPKTLSWNKSTDCCSWDGVNCDETTGQVIELHLSCSRLQGKFHSNSSLFQLSNLKRLDLSANNFYGSLISPKFGEFSSLTHLDLSRSNFSGLIPAEISHLSKLYVLRIGDYYSYGLRLEPHNFEPLLKNLTQLRALDLSNVNISSTIPLNFSSFLTTLYISNSQLFGILPERVFHLSDLESLYLSSNPQLIVRFPTTKWNSSASLKYLNLNSVNFTGKIPESFSYLTSLDSLGMSSCNLSGPIPKHILNLTSITSLFLGRNNLSGQIECSSYNQSWTSLDFSSNSLTGLIPSCISSLPSLEWLDLNNNNFTGSIQDFKSKTLRIIVLKHNQLQGPIPKSFLNQQSLQVLILSQNNLSGQINSSICNLKTLQVLHLGGNNLDGSIPQCLGEMSELLALDLSNNSLSGTINTTFRIDNQLRVIHLDRNKLQGKVPPSLVNCKYFEHLDLGNNELIDTFPNWLGALPNLKILNLRSNKLHGPIKASKNKNLFTLTFLAVLNLSHNHLVGCIPKGKQFDTFDNSSYQGNDGLRGFSLSKDCGGDDGVQQAITPVELDEGDSTIISWQAFLMGYGCGLIVVLSVIYIMLATQNPTWFSRMIEELKHKIITRMQKYKIRN